MALSSVAPGGILNRRELIVALVLLCHKLRRERSFVFAPQHGQRERMATSFAMSRRRKVEIELGTWRSGRNGGASRSVTFGKGKLWEENFGNRF